MSTETPPIAKMVALVAARVQGQFQSCRATRSFSDHGRVFSKDLSAGELELLPLRGRKLSIECGGGWMCKLAGSAVSDSDGSISRC